MIISLKLQAPAGIGVVKGISGNSYAVDAQGFVTVTDSSDVEFLLNDGFTYVNFGSITLSGLLFESATSGIIANPGGGQANAVALTTEVNHITTCATAGDSVKLPAAVAGVTIMVINHGVKPAQVFGLSTDTIDDVVATTGVPQMVNSTVIYICTITGKWYTEGLATGYAGPGLQTLSYNASGIIANPGGTQGGAVALTQMVNRVGTVGTQGDSVALPPSVPGLSVIVINRGALPMQVFGANPDTINGIATATGISQGVNTSAVYTCTVAGNWEVPISSLVTTTPQSLPNNAAIPPHVSHDYVITKGSVEANTLAAPTAGVDDGITISISSTTAFAHTLTATGLLQTGTASVNLATFAAFAGAGLTLLAFNGKWVVQYSVGITFS